MQPAIVHALARIAHGLYALLVFAAATGAGVGFGLLFRRMVRRTLALGQVPRGVADLAAKMVYYSVVGLAAVVGLALAGVDVTGFAFAGSVVGVALGFAAQTVASNFFSGLFIYIDKPLQPGEYIELPDYGVLGRVVEITMFSTRIETIDGRILRMPNEEVFRARMVNLQRSVARRLDFTIGISYDADPREARDAIARALDRDPYVLDEPPPRIYVDELGDSAVVLRVEAWVPSWRWLEARRRLLEEMKRALDEAGVEIPYPQRVVWLRVQGGGDEAGLELALRGAAEGAGGPAEALG